MLGSRLFDSIDIGFDSIIASRFIGDLYLDQDYEFTDASYPCEFMDSGHAFRYHDALDFRCHISLAYTGFFDFTHFIFDFNFASTRGQDRTLLFRRHRFFHSRFIELFIMDAAFEITSSSMLDTSIFRRDNEDFANRYTKRIRIRILHARRSITTFDFTLHRVSMRFQ